MLPAAATATNPLGSARGKGSTKRLLRTYNANSPLPPKLSLTATGSRTPLKTLDLFDRVKIGRQTSSKNAPAATNGVFDSKVLSRNHAEVWAQGQQVLLKDLGSSNGTFLNGQRLSDENQESQPVEVRDGDVIEFGIDILDENGVDVLYRRVAVTASISSSEDDGGLQLPEQDLKRATSTDSTITLRRPDDNKTAAPPRPEGNKELQSVVSTLQTQLAKAKEQTTHIDALSNQVQGLEQTVDQYQSRSSTANSELADFKEQFKLLLVQYNSAVAQNSTLVKQVDQLSDQVQELKQTKADLETEKQALSLARKEKQDLYTQNELLNEHLAKLKEEVKAMKEVKAEVAKLQAETATLKKRQARSARPSLASMVVMMMLLAALLYQFLFLMDGWLTVEDLVERHLGPGAVKAVQATRTGMEEAGTHVNRVAQHTSRVVTDSVAAARVHAERIVRGGEL
ncbi:hypothetical protein RI367_003706 [Sorochytrium milnesiophthora]